MKPLFAASVFSSAIIHFVLASMHPTAPLETWCKDEERRDECYHLVESPAVNWSEAHSVCTDVPDLTLSSGEDTSFLSQWMYLNHTDDDDTYTVWISGKWSEQQDNWFTVEGQPTIALYSNDPRYQCGVYYLFTNKTKARSCTSQREHKLSICQFKSTQGKCPEDSLLLHGSCYTIEKNTWFDKWRDAEDYCHVTYPGGHLAYEHLADDNLITKIQQSLGDHSATTELWVGIRKYHWMWNREDSMVDNRPVLHSPWFLTNTTQNACLAVQLSKNNTKFSPQPCEQPLKYILCQGEIIAHDHATIPASNSSVNTTDTPQDIDDNRSRLSTGHIITICVGVAIVIVLLVVITLISRRVVMARARKDPPLVPNKTDDPSTLCADNTHIPAWHDEGHHNAEFHNAKMGPYMDRPRDRSSDNYKDVVTVESRTPEITEL